MRIYVWQAGGNDVDVVWLDYSERERRKMLDVIDLFREHDTRDSAIILPATVTRTLPSAGEIVMGWSGPGILISLLLLLVVSIVLLTLSVKASNRHRREYSHR